MSFLYLAYNFYSQILGNYTVIGCGSKTLKQATKLDESIFPSSLVSAEGIGKTVQVENTRVGIRDLHLIVSRVLIRRWERQTIWISRYPS